MRIDKLYVYLFLEVVVIIMVRTMLVKTLVKKYRFESDLLPNLKN